MTLEVTKSGVNTSDDLTILPHVNCTILTLMANEDLVPELQKQTPCFLLSLDKLFLQVPKLPPGSYGLRIQTPDMPQYQNSITSPSITIQRKPQLTGISPTVLFTSKSSHPQSLNVTGRNFDSIPSSHLNVTLESQNSQQLASLPCFR